MYVYRSVLSKCLWAVGIHRTKMGVGAYTEKPFVRIPYNTQTVTIGSSIMWGGRLLRTLQYYHQPQSRWQTN